MIALQLYVNNQLVEMFDDESVTLTQTIQDVKNIDKIFVFTSFYLPSFPKGITSYKFIIISFNIAWCNRVI